MMRQRDFYALFPLVISQVFCNHLIDYSTYDPFYTKPMPLSCATDMFEYCYEIWIRDPDDKHCKPGNYMFYGRCQDYPCDVSDPNCERILDPNGGVLGPNSNVGGNPNVPFSQVTQSVTKNKVGPGGSTREPKTGFYICPKGAVNGEQFADYNDCRFYFSCWATKSERFDCGFAKHFANGECQDGVCPYRIPGALPQEPTSYLPTGKFTPCIRGTFYCPVVPEKGFKLYPDPNDCRYHYQCWSNGANRFDCGKDNHFDVGASRCVPGICPSAFANCPPLKQGRACETGVHICHGAAEEHDRNDCRYYFECSGAGEMATKRKDCGPGRSFYLGKCLDEPCSYALPDCPPLNAEADDVNACEVGAFSCPEGSTPGSKYPDPVNCRYYYECSAIGAFRYDCGQGTHYDKATGKCAAGFCPHGNPQCAPLDQDRKCLTQLRKCPQAGLIPDLNNCQYYFVCPGPGQYASELKDCGIGKSFQNGNCTDQPCPYALPGCPPQEPNDLSKCQIGTFYCPPGVGWGTSYVDPANCRYYFECWQDGACRFDCGANKHFNGEISTCVDGDCPSGNPNCPPMDQGRKCLTGPFRCSSTGLPYEHDLNDCRYYFECPGPNQLPSKRLDCGVGKSFLNGKCNNVPCSYALPNCPPQDVFDLRSCKTGTFNCPQYPGYIKKFPDPANCRYYYECWAIGACREDCGVGKHFDEDANRCVDGVCKYGHPECPPYLQGRPCLTGTFRCSDTGLKQEHDQNDCRYYFDCPGPGKYGTRRYDCGEGRSFLNGECQNKPCVYTLPNCKPQEADDKSSCEKGAFTCPVGAGLGSRFPDTVNCRYYYECSGDGARRFDCGTTRYYDKDRNMCVEGSCPFGNPNCPPLSQTRKVLTGIHKCAVAGYEPDLNDCRYYFLCKGAGIFSAERYDCGNGKHFEGGRCVDKPCSYALENVSPQNPDDLSSCQKGTFECPEKSANSFIPYPDPNNCRYYFECWSTGANMGDCGEERHYDTYAKKCVPGYCLSGNPNCPPMKQGRPCLTGTYQCPAAGQYHDLNDCRYYFQCQGPNMPATARLDCGPGRNFDRGQCHDGPCTYTLPDCKPQDAFDTRNCPKGTFKCPVKPSTSFLAYPNPTNCRYFFQCWADGAKRMDCGLKKHYVQDQGREGCYDGVCPTGNPNCPPLDQERTCKKNYHMCFSSNTLEQDVNDCRYYFHCKTAGQPADERLDCGVGKSFTIGGKCTSEPCIFALPNCPPQLSLKELPIRYLKDLKIVYGTSPSQQPAEVVEDSIHGLHDINYGYEGKLAWLVPSWTVEPSLAATSFEVSIQADVDTSGIKLPKSATDPPDNRYLFRKFDSMTQKRISRVGLLRDPQPSENLYERRNDFGWDDCTTDMNVDRGGDMVHLCWNYVVSKAAPQMDIS